MSDRVKTNILLCIVAVFLVVSISIQGYKAAEANEELMTRNAYAILMPLVELRTEAGPTTGETKKIHSRLFSEYIENINDHQLSLPLKPFALTAKKIDVTELDRIIDKFKDEPTGEGYKVAIEKLFGELKQYLNKEYELSRKSDVPEEKRREVAAKLENSHIDTLAYISGIDTSDVSKIEESFNDAVVTCLTNRMAVCDSFLSSYTYENLFVSNIVNTDDLIKFREDIDRIIYHNTKLRDLLDSEKYEKYHIKLDRYTYSESRRRDLVQAVIDDDMQKAQDLLLAAMEIAISSSN